MVSRAREARGDVKEQVRARLNIAEVVGAYVQLRKVGKSLVGLCPFHQEKTPSFNVDPQKGLYYCFGCQAGGDIFDFVMQLEGMAFPEALALLAEKAGVALPAETRAAPSKEQRLKADLWAVNDLAQGFFRRTLEGPRGRKAREYLRMRGLKPATVQHFDLGYAVDSWDALRQYLADSSKEAEGIRSGLLVAKSGGGAYDRFRGRIMFPFVDSRGRVVAFGGRSLGEEEPKYLNSPETLVYAKRRELYGFGQAKEAMRQKRRAVVVEGYFDCLALHQSGIDYAVASCGTTLTTDHVRLLRRFADDVYLCFDADTAGRQATAKGLEVLQESGLSVRVIVLPDGHDPDSFIVEQGSSAFLGQIERALPITDYLLEEALSQADLRSVAGRMKGVRAALPILRRVESPVERDAYIQRIAARLGVSAQSLAREVHAGGQLSRAGDRGRHTNLEYRDTSRDSGSSLGRRVIPDARALLEREMIRCLLQDASGATVVIETLGDAPFHTEYYNRLLQALADGKSGAALLEEVKDEAPPMITSLLMQPVDNSLSWRDCLGKMRLELLREELEAIEEGLATLTDHNPVEYLTYMTDGLLAFGRWRRLLKSYCDSQSEAS